MNNIDNQNYGADKNVAEWRLKLVDSIYVKGSKLKTLIDDELIVEGDRALLRSELADYILRKSDTDTLINNSLAYSESNENVINRFLDLALVVVKDAEKAANGTMTSAASLAIASDNESIIQSAIQDQAPKAPLSKTAETLMSLATEPTRPNLAKQALLDEIENPTQTVKEPDFALPKSKPATMDILKDLADKTPGVPAAEFGLDETVPDLIDPFKPEKNSAAAGSSESAITAPTISTSFQSSGSGIQPKSVESTLIFSNDPTQTPASAIEGNFDKKLNSVTSNQVNESYKLAGNATNQNPSSSGEVANTPKHDPYREAVEI